MASLGKLLLPRNKAEGDIPQIAVVSGHADAMECVLYKMGLDVAEFTVPSGTGRVHVYRGSGDNPPPDEDGPGLLQVQGVSAPSEVTLYSPVSGAGGAGAGLRPA